MILKDSGFGKMVICGYWQEQGMKTPVSGTTQLASQEVPPLPTPVVPTDASEVVCPLGRNGNQVKSDSELKASGGFLAYQPKKSGLSMVTLNLHVQPRLPGSVVGEMSMLHPLKSDKITEASVLK
jgi:hypothetical protein